MMRGKPSLAYKIKHGIPPDKTEAKSLNAFLNASRQVSNTPKGFNLSATSADEPKLNAAFREINKRYKTDKNYRGVTYSNYLSSGVAPMASRLSDAGIPFAEFTGKLSDKKKKEVIENYNAGNIKHLLISGAGSEGLDLKGTKLLQVLEPHWNDPKIDQVIGRAVRYQSHAHLPEGERKVEIQRLTAIPRKHGIFFKKRDMGADEYLAMLSKKKTELNTSFLKALQEVGE
jgi:superfamily II DNA or RNA helicase